MLSRNYDEFSECSLWRKMGQPIFSTVSNTVPFYKEKSDSFSLPISSVTGRGRYPLEGIILKCPAMVLYRNNSALDTGHLSFVDLLAPAAICTAGVHILTEQHLFRLSL